jgi:hypothetical protein
MGATPTSEDYGSACVLLGVLLAQESPALAATIRSHFSSFSRDVTGDDENLVVDLVRKLAAAYTERLKEEE